MPEPKSRFGSKTLKESDRTFNHNQEKTLLCYIKNLQKTLSNCELSEDLGVHAVTKTILQIFKNLYLPQVQVLKPENAPVHTKMATSLPEVCNMYAYSL